MISKAQTVTKVPGEKTNSRQESHIVDGGASKDVCASKLPICREKAYRSAKTCVSDSSLFIVKEAIQWVP